MAPVFFTAKTLAAKSCPFLVFSFIPVKSCSIFHVILIKGVLFKSILISFPSPEAALSATAFKKFHDLDVSELDGLAIMSDTDNSKMKAIAYFQNIYFSTN